MTEKCRQCFSLSTMITKKKRMTIFIYQLKLCCTNIRHFGQWATRTVILHIYHRNTEMWCWTCRSLSYFTISQGLNVELNTFTRKESGVSLVWSTQVIVGCLWPSVWNEFDLTAITSLYICFISTWLM